MSKLYLSDLHLGNQFFKSQEFLILLIQDDKFKEINLIGDIFDVWDMRLGEIYARHHKFFLALNTASRTKKVRLIKGNHDPEFSSLKSYLPDIDFFSKHYIDRELGLICVHGDEFSDSILKHSWLSKLLYLFLVSPIHKTFKINLRDKFKDLLGSVARYREKDYYTKICTDIEKNAIETYQSEFNYVLMGHTHLPKHATCEDNECHCEYINCGDWIHNRSYVVYEEDKFKLIELDEDYNVSNVIK